MLDPNEIQQVIQLYYGGECTEISEVKLLHLDESVISLEWKREGCRAWAKALRSARGPRIIAQL